MEKVRGSTLRFVYGIFFSLLSVFVGALFIRQIWSIYRSAPQSPYSVESISLHFNQIALPVWLWVAAVAGNILLSVIFPEQAKRPEAYRDTVLALERAKNSLRLEGEALERTEQAAQRHENFRKAVYGVCGFVTLALAILCFGALLGFAYFPIIEKEFFADHNGLVDKLVQCAVLSVLALILGCVAAELNARSREKERKIYLQAKAGVFPETVGKENKRSAFLQKLVNALCFWKKGANKKTCQKCKMKGVWLARAVIFVLAIVLLIVGVCNGGMKEMFLKAINICTQCIGLG